MEAENLFEIEYLNLKNGNNAILVVDMICMDEGDPCTLQNLPCVMVDDAVAATNNLPPYNFWYIEADFIYSETCDLGISSKDQNIYSIYPNPTKEVLNIVATDKTEDLSISISTMDGKILKTQSLSFKNQASLDISQLASGIYFLSIQDESGNSKLKKFIKE